MAAPLHPGQLQPPRRSSRILSRLLKNALTIFATVSALGLVEAHGQIEGALADRYKSAMESFGKGEFPAAITTLQEMLAQGSEGPGMDSVRFSLAAAYYNNKEYKKARERFEEYLKLTPQGPKASDAMLSLAETQLAMGDKAGAAKTFASIAQAGGPNKDQALLAQASLLKAAKKNEEALALLQPVLAGGVKSQESVQAAMMLSSLEVAKGNRDRAFQIASLLHNRPDLIDNPLELNALTFEIGDSFIAGKEYRKALKAYALVRQKDEAVMLQKTRLQNLTRQIDINAAAAKTDPARSVELLNANHSLQSSIESVKGALSEVDKAPSTLLPLRLRQARCYQDAGRFWESILIFENLLVNGLKEGLDEVLFSLGAAHAELGNTDEALAALTRSVKEFPKGKSADASLYLQGILFLQKERYEEARPVFAALLESYPKSKHAEQALFLLGNTHFALAQYPKALESYSKYLKQVARGDHLEEVIYRSALCHFLSGDYAKALPALQDYSKTYPAAAFSPDALYRTGVCYMAAKKYQEVLEICERWEADFGLPSLRAEVLSLKGDALAGKGDRPEAVIAYRAAVENAVTDQVVQYALFEANKQLQRLGRWDLSADMLDEFLKKHPDHSVSVGAIYWYTRAMIKQGKTSEAKTFLSEKIYAVIEDRSKDAVEQLLSQLAQLCVKRPPAPPKPVAESADQSQLASAPEAPPPYDPVAEMTAYVDPAKVPNSPLAKARILFAQSELFRLTKHPVEAAKLMDKICDETPPSALGAALLAQSGDRMLERKNVGKAKSFYNELMKAFPKSELLDYSYNGLGQIELASGKYQDAIRWFDDAIDKVGASTKLKDVVLGRGKALLELGKLDDAKKSFEQVASTREWKGESSAEAVLLLGEVLFRKGDFTGAVQNFQRVSVAYQRYLASSAKAYIRAGDCFEKLGNREKAEASYKELLSKQKFSELPEFAEAKKRLNLTEAP